MKLPFVDFKLYNQILAKNQSSKMALTNSDNIQTASRSSIILKSLAGKKISVYNGKNSTHLYITPSMLGKKLGIFVLTKKLGNSIHNSDHNRKVKEKARRKITQKKVRKTTASTKTKISSVSKKK